MKKPCFTEITCCVNKTTKPPSCKTVVDFAENNLTIIVVCIVKQSVKLLILQLPVKNTKQANKT